MSNTDESSVIEPGTVYGHRIQLDETRSVWVGRHEDKTLITFVNSHGENTNVLISKDARSALLQLLMEDCA